MDRISGISSAAYDPDYRPTPYSLSNSEVESTGILCGGAIRNIARELLESRMMIANLRAALEKATMEAPPDAIFVRDENGERKLCRYIGPTIQELRDEAKAKAEAARVQAMREEAENV